MATPPPVNPTNNPSDSHSVDRSAFTAPWRVIKRIRVTALLILVVVFVLCIAFSWTTRDAMSNLSFLRGAGRSQFRAGTEKTSVDLSPWQTAQALAALAVTAEERGYSREAERLADHEVDQAFASALRRASLQPPVVNKETIAISARIKELEAVAKADQARVDSLTPAAEKSPTPAKGTQDQPSPSSDDLDLAKAQLGLDQDELEDAREELAHATGDQRPKIQQELAAHQAEQAKYDAQVRDRGQVAVLSVGQTGTLAGRIRGWFAQNSRYKLLQQAIQAAQSDIARISAQRDAAAAQANAANASATQPGGAVQTGSDNATRLVNLKHRSQQQQLLSIENDRILTQQQLVTIYGKWASQVLLQHRIVLHLILQSCASIVFILICVILCNMLVHRLMDRPGLDGRRLRTLRNLTVLGVQLVGLVLIMLVTFGVPKEISTIVGLTTAGLTVALQAFILAFVGWFILMGKNGIRVGDWVEINGVGGEVVEISLFRTTLLETGNWTDKGHPTGRRVTFINNFAISGQYFNFSTAGQWMWDEFSISVPATADTYKIVELIHKGVAEETEKDSRLAEAEWKHASRQDGMTQFSADPSVSLRPSGAGVDLVLRYVTRAYDRFDTRNRLYKLVMEALHKQTPQPSA